jgi:hypothetical protein
MDVESPVIVAGGERVEDVVGGGVWVGSGVGGPGFGYPVRLLACVAAPDEAPDGVVDGRRCTQLSPR